MKMPVVYIHSTPTSIIDPVQKLINPSLSEVSGGILLSGGR
jgi:hypothetical protein